MHTEQSKTLKCKERQLLNAKSVFAVLLRLYRQASTEPQLCRKNTCKARKNRTKPRSFGLDTFQPAEDKTALIG